MRLVGRYKNEVPRPFETHKTHETHETYETVSKSCSCSPTLLLFFVAAFSSPSPLQLSRFCKATLVLSSSSIIYNILTWHNTNQAHRWKQN